MTRLLFAAVAALAFAAPAPAAVIIGNLPPTNDGAGTSVASAVSQQKAVVFTTGGTGFTVDNVILRLSNYNTVAGDVAQVGFFLDNGSGTNTGAQVGSFLTAPASGSNATGDFTFLPAGPLTLAANTTYWLLVDSSPGDFIWRASDPGLTATGPGATFVANRFSTNNGASYGPPDTFFNSFQINGTQAAADIPEPTTLAVFGLLAAGGMAARRRKA